MDYTCEYREVCWDRGVDEHQPYNYQAIIRQYGCNSFSFHSYIRA